MSAQAHRNRLSRRYIPKTGRLEALAMVPEYPPIPERERLDSQPEGTYKTMIQRGELIQAGRRVSDISELFREAVARFGRPILVISDRFKKRDTLQALEANNLPLECRMAQPNAKRECRRRSIVSTCNIKESYNAC